MLHKNKTSALTGIQINLDYSVLENVAWSQQVASHPVSVE